MVERKFCVSCQVERPASEQAFYKKKWADFRAICNQSVDDIAPKVKEAAIYQWKRK